MYFVYCLKSLSKERTYIGLTSNINRRIKEHNSGRNRSTKAFVPWQLVYSEEFEDISAARKREKYFKSGSGREYLKLKWPSSSTG